MAYRQRPSYHPSVLLKLYIYGYLNRVQSSRRLEREAGRNVEDYFKTNRHQISTWRSHPNPKGFRMLTPVAGGDAHCGPFFELTASQITEKLVQFTSPFLGEAVSVIQGLPDLYRLKFFEADLLVAGTALPLIDRNPTTETRDFGKSPRSPNALECNQLHADGLLRPVRRQPLPFVRSPSPCFRPVPR
jgi:hypothetical protein